MVKLKAAIGVLLFDSEIGFFAGERSNQLSFRMVVMFRRRQGVGGQRASIDE